MLRILTLLHAAHHSPRERVKCGGQILQFLEREPQKMQKMMGFFEVYNVVDFFLCLKVCLSMLGKQSKYLEAMT